MFTSSVQLFGYLFSMQWRSDGLWVRAAPGGTC